MPKQTLNINKFEGGLNTDTDPRDLKENQFSELKGAYIDKPQYNSLTLSRTSTPTGYGLFQFGTDYDWEGVYTGSEKFTVLTDDHLIKIHDDSWETGDEQGVHGTDDGSTVSTLGLHSSSLGADINNVFYYNNNALRCSMSNRTGSAGKSKWIGYIDNYFFLNNNDTGGGTSPGNKDFLKKGWFIEDQFIAPPTEVFIGNWNIARPAISAFADYNGTVAGTTKATTASSHSLLTGDTVTITSSPDSYYNDTYTITKIDADEFYFTKAYSAEDSGILSTGQHSSISEFESFADCTDSYHWDEITTANLISISYAESDNDTNMSVALQSRWLLGISYIYDGIDGGESPEGMKGVNYPYAQESSITVLVDDKSSNVYKILDFTGYTEAPIIQAHFKAGSSRNDAVNTQLIGMNSRITGMRFYIKEFEGEGDISALKKEPTKPWLRIAEADLCQGVWTCFTAPISNDSSNDEQEAITSRITSVNDTRGNNWNGSANGGAEFMTITTTGTDADIGAAISTAGGMLNGIPLFDLPIESYYSLNGYKDILQLLF